MSFRPKNSLASSLLLLFLLAGLFGCKPGAVEGPSSIQVGFTANLYDVQPHLAVGMQPDDKAIFHLASLLQPRDDIKGNILQSVRDAGYEYLELNTAEIALLTDAEFETAYEMIRQVGLEVPVTNVFVPGHIKLVGPEVDAAVQDAYLRVAYQRLHRLGVTYLVFGSAGARRIPDGFPREEAWEQLAAFSRRAAEKAGEYDIMILIEPLRRQETNFINTTAEGFELVRAVGHPNFQLMIDFYHLAVENEDPDIVLEVADYLHHIHVANPNGRVFPLDWDEHPYYEAFFRNLREIGYDKRVSVEARFDDFHAESRRSIQMMREAFDPDRW